MSGTMGVKVTLHGACGSLVCLSPAEYVVPIVIVRGLSSMTFRTPFCGEHALLYFRALLVDMLGERMESRR